MEEADELSRPSFQGGDIEDISCAFPNIINDSTTGNPNQGQVKHQQISFNIQQDAIPDLEGVLLAAWAVLLNRYIGIEQVCFGVFESSRRSSTGATTLVDDSLSRYSVCRVSVPSSQTVSDLVLDCKALMYACRLKYTGVRGKTRFNTAVYFADYESVKSLRGSAGNLALELGDFDMILVASRSRPLGSECCYIRYSSSFLSDAAATLVIANYQAILTDIVSVPELTVGQLCKASSEDLAATWSWNRTCPDAVDDLVHDLFRRNVLSHPDKLAISASDSSFTYRELDVVSNILANFLVDSGVGPETIVPLCFDKSAWTTISMLAVAKSGGAFAFIDPSYSTERAQNILRQVKAKFILCSTSNFSIWNDRFSAYEVSSSAIKKLPQLCDAPDIPISPSNLLYVAFTSGSSGEPKGVCVGHSSYLSSALHFARVSGVNSSSRILQFAPYTFDPSIQENFIPLLCGGVVCIPDELARSKGIAHILNEFQVNWAFFTPSLVRSINPEAVNSLQSLFLAGEAPSRADVDAWAGKVRLMNGYGPTECSIVSAVNPSLDTSADAENIGWPVGGCLWVVDIHDYNQLVPIGATGELAIEGPHLARGYLNDPEKTSTAFIDSPNWAANFTPSRKIRIYLTGDVVRRNIDGSIVYIKRKDTQTKVRGMRIELGAIEQQILSSGLARLCSAMVPADGPCKNRLVAVVSITCLNSYADGKLRAALNSRPLQDGVCHCIRDIRSRLADDLPQHMIPSTWFVLESFPLMSSSKIDKGAVKKWIEGMTAETLRESECILDHEPIEEAPDPARQSLESIVEFLREAIGFILNLPQERVILWRSFISLGGDSISALQLISRCREHNMVIKVRDILRCTSVTELASCVEFDENKLSIPQAEELPGVPFGLSPIQQLYFQWEPEGTLSGGENRFNQSFLLRMNQPISSDSLQAAVATLVARHSILRYRFVKSPGVGWQQFISADSDSPFGFEEHFISDIQELQDITFRSQCRIDMTRGPIFNVDLINNSDGQILSMIAHHVVIDLVSWRVIMRDLQHLLQGRNLPARRSISWPVWCKLQADYASRYLPPHIAFPRHVNEITGLDLEYWGMKNESNTFKDIIRADIQLDSATTSLLMDTECHQELRIEPIDLFLTAVIHSFARVFHDRKVPTIYRESHGRELWDDSIDISSTVGWFTTIYPISVEVLERGDIIDTIRRVKDAQRRIPRNGWPYFASRFHHDDGIREFQAPPIAEISFDYLGLYQQLEGTNSLFRQESWDNIDVGPEFKRPSLFEITTEIIQGRLRMRFEYNKNMNHQPKIRRWVQECEEDLRHIVSVLDHAMYTLSDFPFLRIGYDGLDNLLASVLPNMGISLGNVEDVYDTSPMQTGVLLSQAKDPVFYQCCIVFRVDTTSPFESVDAERLISAWRSLVRRHSSLRTIFIPKVFNDNSFVQVVLKTADVRVSRVFYSSAELGGVLKVQESIQLHDALPPHKLTICDTEDGRLYIKINFSHASIDGASGEILVRDLLDLYDGSQELPPAPCYRDFISLVQSYNQEDGLRYWDGCLSGVEPCHIPVLDDGVVQDRTFQIVRVSSPKTVQQLTQWCQSCNITLSTLFKLVWGLVLRAYTGSNKICFGYIVSGRDDLDVDARENALGVFTNMLTCRADLTGSLKAILNQIHEDSLRDLQHQYCSLAQIQRRTRSHKLGNQQPLFNTYLNFQLNRPKITSERSPISLSLEYLYEPIDFSCVFDVAVTGEHLHISLAHCTTSVSSAQARNIASACAVALERVFQSPMATLVNKLSIMGEDSDSQIWAWNSSLPPRVDTCIHDIISCHATANPSAPAVESCDGTFSYAQLDEITTRVSRHLAHLGIGTGCIVPLYFERSAWIIVSMIAVVKTGAAFVLLDPKHTSPARTSTMIMDTQAKIAIAGQKESISLGAVIPELIIVVVDSSHMEAIKSCTDCYYDEDGLLNEIGASRTSARDPAYIIFTSGTTGKPKGSITSHAAFCTAAAAYGKRLGLSPSTRVLQVASYTFDVCLLEMLMVLLFRGCVCVPTEQDRANDIAEAINQAQANTMIITPSVAHLIAQNEVPTLKTLILTGESMSKADIECWKGHVRLINGYGPSECSVLCTVNDAVAQDPLNIGKPAGSCCWIVSPDDHQLLLPIGATGELIVESFALADGYFNNEAKTAESFIKPPQWLSGRRSGDSQVTRHVYKTGDLVRYNSDGSLCFIGRKDMQSKINGQRIEYGEIEDYLLSRCPFMNAVAVEVIKPEARQSRQTLAAFFKFISATDEVAHPTTSLPEGSGCSTIFLGLSDDIINQLQTLKSSLAEVLPSFMIPSMFIPLDALPLTSTGKLNRTVLREVAAKLSAEKLNKYSLLASTSKYQALTSDIAKRLRGAWAETLSAAPETITGDSNFFHLGGDSLNAMRLVSIAAKNYNVTVAVVDIFKNPRLWDLASLARDCHVEVDIAAHTSDMKPFSLLGPNELIDEVASIAALQCNVQEKRILDLYPCTALQEGLMMLSTTNKCAYVAQTVFRLPKTLDVYRFKRAWDVVVEANPILRTRIIRTEVGGCLQVVLDDSATWLFQDCPLEKYLIGDISAPITWGAPLHRFAVLTAPDSAHTHLVWTAHHSLFDEWSQGLILEQLERAYKEETLPRLVPFNHFIAHITDSDDSLCATFWSAQMSGDIPASLPQVTSKTYVPRAESFHERIMVIKRGIETASQITTPTIIRAAWALVIGRYAEAEDVIFGASLSGRGAPIHGIDRINGPTLATVPIKVHLDRECPISEFLETIQEQATDMMPFEHWGIQNIAQISRNAAFQNLLTVHPIRTGITAETPLGLERVTKTHAEYHIYPLIVECFLTDDNRVKLSIQYDAHVVPYAPQLASLFERLILQLALRSNDESSLRSLVFCSPEEKTRIFEWNREAPKMVNDCIHELISKNAKCRPEAEAICCWDLNMTYTDLDLLSSKLARHLAYLGVRPEQIVPALFEKSAWAIVTQLAILKAGGVMCMLDPSHPLQRLEDSIDTTDANLVLASETYSAVLQGKGLTILIVGSSTMHSITDACSVSTLSPVRPDQAAYVVFTSGTTGRPKASITEHRAFVSSSNSYAASMQISESTRALQHAAFSFDPYLLETFATLIQGGCVCVVKDEARSDVVELANAIRTMGVTWTAMIPSVARLLPRNDIPTLKTICLTGEPVSPTDRYLSDTVKLMNGYGPSECSVISALEENITLDSDYTSIGRGVGSRCWIVEPHDHDILTPIGCIGELLLESPGLARGYLKEPKKTAEVFISSPAWLRDMRPNTRMYKTGDLVRYNPDDGSISYVGRRDQQVKLHGQRLELGEIEHHILADDNVAIAAVACPKTGAFKGKLVATLAFRFTITASINDPSLTLKLASQSDKFTVARQLSEVQSRLESHLPSYMIPLVWAVVLSIPLTTSLKVDRRAIVVWLETMDDAVAREVMELTHAEDPSSKTSTALERQLQDMIGQVLGLPTNRVFLNRSFIGLGGDSIAAIQLIARCRAVNMTFKLKDILKSKNISQLAELAAINGNGVRQGHFTANKINNGPGSAGTGFGLSPIQKLYFNLGAGQMQAQSSSKGSSHWNLGVLLRLRRGVSVEILANAVKSIVEQHPMLRARFTYDKSKKSWTQHIRPMTREVYCFQHYTLESQERMTPIITASQRRLDACKGAVFSVDSFEVKGSIPRHGQQPEKYLFMVAHHLVIDLVSWRIVIHDIEEIIHTGKHPLSESFSFEDWVNMQEVQAATNTLQRCEEPSNLPSVVHADYQYWGISPDANLFGDTITTSFSLDIESTKALLGACNRAFGTRPAELFVAALLDSFANIFDDRDLPPVYYEGHGRDCPWDSSIDLSSIVGWFTVIYPVQVQLGSGDRSITDAVRRVKDAHARISERSLSSFASRLLAQEGPVAYQEDWPMEILFNFLGQHLQQTGQDTLLCPVTSPDVPGSPNYFNGDGTLPTTANVGPQCRRLALFDINVQIDNDGRASIFLSFNRKSLYQEKIHLWISAYRQSLLRAVDQLSKMPPERTLSDFPLMPLTYDDLDLIKSETVPALGLANFEEVEDIYPCGPTQKGILISQARSACTYHESFLYAITPRASSPVIFERLAQAWKQVVARCVTLRTVFAECPFIGEEGYCQIVLRSLEPRIDHLECIDDAAAVEQISKTKKAGVSDSRGKLPTEPPHSILFCQTPDKVYMHLEISHALIDGESMLTLIRDLAMAYEGITSPRTNLPRYQDYIAHIRSLPTSDSITYWMDYIDGMQPCHMPALADQVLIANGSTHTAGLQSIPIEFHESSKDIINFCREQNLTPMTVFQVAWALVLRIYTGQDDVCFGYLVSGRDVPVDKIETLVGVVCNVLIIRMHLDSCDTGIELLVKAQDDWVNSLPHQFVSQADIQHHRLQQWTNDTTSFEASNALFNTSVSFRSEARSTEAESHQVSLEFELLGGTEDFEHDATVSIWSSATNSFRGSFSYRPSHISTGQAISIINTFTKAVKRLIGMSTRHLNEWSLVTENDVTDFARFQCPEPSNAASSSTGQPEFDGFIDEIVEMRAQEAPNREAVCSWDGRLTYRELEDLSTRLANHLLVHHHVGPEVLVPICMEKSLWFVVSVLGVLKAGGAFVPLDANQPSRFQSLIEQTEAKFVLTSAVMKEAISKIGGSSAVVIDEGLVTQSPADQPLSMRQKRDQANAAYVIFTSGSTGIPKGVIIEHRAWVSSATGQIDSFGFDANTRIFQFSSYSFDASVGEVLSTLMAGGCICIPSEAERLNDIEGAIARTNANVMFMAPSLSRALKPENVPNLHTIIIGGENIPEREIQRWRRQGTLVSVYGPTECSMMASAIRYTKLSADLVRPNDIGRPNRCKYWVVSATDHNMLLPPGAIGELLIEGIILARGYLRDATRTTAAFIENPAWAIRHDGEIRRMYRTGDIVQYQPEGWYKYMGRKDKQVKIRGQRVELGEVEHHLRNALNHKYSVAVEAVEESSNARLVAFVALGNLYEIATVNGLEHPLLHFMEKRQLQAAIAATAPSYMVFSVVVPLQGIPLLPSGKVDRKQLRNIGRDFLNKEAGTSPIASPISDMVNGSARPELTSTQKRMRKVWATVLNRDEKLIDLDASFLEQGGDSLLAIRLASACRSAGLVVSVSDILRKQGINAICQAEDNRGKQLSSSKIPEPLPSLNYTDDLELVRAICAQVDTDAANIEDIAEATAMQSLFISTGLRSARGYMNYFSLHFRGDINENRLKDACQALVAKHSILRTIFLPFERCVYQVALRSLEPRFQVYKYPGAQQRKLAVELIKADQAEHVAIGQANLRFFLIHDEGRSTLVVRLSHAQYDGMSLRVFIGDLEGLYQNKPLSVRPAFIDFVHAARERNGHGAEEYWRKLLAGSTMTTIIPRKSPRFRKTERRIIHREITMPLEHQYRTVTFSTILKAAWALVLGELAHSTDVVFGHLITGRNVSLEGMDVNEILGPCLNIIPVRVKLENSERPITSDILDQIHDQQVAGIPFETFGMDKIVEQCTDWPLWSHFSTVVQYQNLLDGANEAINGSSFTFGDLNCHLTAFEGQYNGADIVVLATPQNGNANIDITLQYDDEGEKRGLTLDCMHDALDRLIDYITMFASTPEGQLQSKISQNPSLLLTQVPTNGNEDTIYQTSIAGNSRYRFGDMPAVIRDIVTKAWESILSPPPGQFIREHDKLVTESTPFYDVWGNLIAASQFAVIYADNGVRMTAEEIIENPSKLAQGVLMAARMHIALPPLMGV
ncbi:hypothetical protein GGR51DRAFT_257654 [Nemania sp. FL0031]|nr:hypothetical protein GGR51DRAFT_257654 [Nemania sp. FL0031]